MRVWLALAAWGCGPGEASRFLVVDGREGDYDLVEAPIPELRDPRRMRGALGDGSVGGYLSLQERAYRGGGPISVRFHTEGRLAVPHTDDGIVLWSYYHALSKFREELLDLGVDVEPIFPVDFAYQPNVGGILFTTTNAAHAGSGFHLFALLADTPKTDLPLAANPGVIRHEFGHAMFQLLVVGDVQRKSSVIEDSEVKALNEGFADMVASLSLDDPNFLAISLPVPGRRVDEDATLLDTDPVKSNPYSRGTVYASLAWDLRELTDPDTALVTAVGALQRWAEEEAWKDGLDGVDRWMQLFVEDAIALDPALARPMCEAYRQRGGSILPEGCP